MKKLLPLICALGLAQPALAANDINYLQALAQSEFRALSEDLGSALSYKTITPAGPLGTTGFDMGIEVTSTKMSKSEQAWKTATNSNSGLGTIYVPKLHIAKGLPLDIDLAAGSAAGRNAGANTETAEKAAVDPRPQKHKHQLHHGAGKHAAAAHVMKQVKTYGQCCWDKIAKP